MTMTPPYPPLPADDLSRLLTIARPDSDSDQDLGFHKSWNGKRR